MADDDDDGICHRCGAELKDTGSCDNEHSETAEDRRFRALLWRRLRAVSAKHRRLVAGLGQ